MTSANIKTGSVTVVEAVSKRLRDEIQNGVLEPGQRLRQAHVAAAYGVSTTPVREAFVKLEREGLLVSSAHRGVVVFRPELEDLRELYEIRIPLELVATRLAVANLTEEDLATMRRSLAGMHRAESTHDADLGGQMNEIFHATIYRAAHRRRLVRLIEDLRASSRGYTRIFMQAADVRVRHNVAEHQAIYDACAAGSPEDAVAAMALHLNGTVDVVSHALDPK